MYPILAGVTMEEVGSASGHAPAITAWACLVPLAAAFLLVFRLPTQAREEE